MDFLDKLDRLMKQNNLNKSSLSKACDIPYTTIDNWYKRGYEGLKLTTLRKLADFFGTSLDFWVDEENKHPNQLTGLASATFNALKPEYQEYILKQIDQLLDIQKKEKEE